MEAYDRRLETLRTDPKFVKASSRRQYNQQLDVLVDELSVLPEFTNATPEVQDQVIQKYMMEDFTPAYEDPGVKASVDQLKQGYMNGDPVARDSMLAYSRYTDTNNKAPLLMSLAQSTQGNEAAMRMAELPQEYANMGLQIQRTNGADDDKAREEFRTLMAMNNDVEGLEQSVDKKTRGVMAAATIGEELMSAAVGVLAGGLVKGARGVAEAGKNGSRLAAWMSNNSLPILTEAGIEGARGVADYINQGVKLGEPNSISGAMKAFGVHAGIDMAIGHAAEGAMDAAIFARKGISRAVTDRVVNAYGDRLARGAIDVPAGVPASLDEDTLRHFASNKMVEDTGLELDAGVRFRDLPELDQANYKAYHQGYGVTKDTDGVFLVQSKSDPGKVAKANNVAEVNEWIGSQKSGYGYYEDLIEAGNEVAAESYRSVNSQINYGLSRKASDEAWLTPKPKRGYVQPGGRQYVTTGELESLANGDLGGQFVRFNVPVDEATLKKGTALFDATEPTMGMVPDEGGNALYFIGEGKLAGPDDVQQAAIRAQARLDGGDVGNATIEELVRDELITSPQAFSAIERMDGKVDLLFSDNIKVSNRYVNPMTGKVGKISDANTVKRPLKAKVSVDVGVNLDDLASSPTKFSAVGSRLLAGNVDAGRLGRYSESFLKTRGLSDTKVTVRTNTTGAVNVSKAKDGRINLSVPREITDGKTQKEVYNSMLKKLEQVTGTTGGPGPKLKSYTDSFRNFQKNYVKGFQSVKDANVWVKGISNRPTIESVQEIGGEYIWKSTKTGSEYRARNLNELVRDIGVNELDQETFIIAAKEAGFDAKSLPKGAVEIKVPGGGVSYIGDDLIVAAKSVDFYPAKLPSSLAPDVAIIEEIPRIDLKANAQAVVGQAPEVSAFMGNFADYNRIAGIDVLVKKKNGNKLLKLGKANYRVHITEMNYTKQFDNAKDARNFLENDWKTIESASEVATDKGMRLGYEDGKFRVYNKGKEITADSIDELHTKLAEVPNPTFGKDIVPDDVRKALDELGIDLELPPGFGKLTADTNAMRPSKDWTKFAETSPGVLNKYMPKVAAIRRMAQTLERAIPDSGLAKSFERLQKNVRIAQGQTFKDGQDLLKMFKEDGKKLIPPDRRKGITKYIENADDPKMLEKIAKDHGLTETDINSLVPQLTDFYKRKALEVGIPYDIMLKNYQPKLRKWEALHDSATDTELLTKDLIASSPELRKYINRRGFENYSKIERASDFIDAIRDDDALSVAMRYTQVGNNELYARRSWDAMYDVLKANKDKVEGQGFISLINSYKDAATHPRSVMHKSSVAKSFQNSATALGLGDTKGRDFLDLLLSLPYASSMAWRPWLPIRNVFQIFTILPLRTGNLHTSAKAAKNLVGNFSSTLDEMISEGIIIKRGATSSAEYMDMMRGASLEAPTKLGQLYRSYVDKGLAWYSMSDDVTRGVAYLASKDMFNKGMAKASVTGNFDPKVFLKQSRADGLPKAVQEEIMSYISGGNVRAAETTMARANIDATMFDYNATNKPLGASGTMGHLYYQFGTYSLNYAQTVGSALTSSASIGSKIKSFTAMALGMGAVAGLAKGAGINNSSFLGYNMIMFNGGPYFQMMINATQAMSSYDSARRDMARRDLMKNLPIGKGSEGLKLQYPALAPGYMPITYGVKWWEDMKDGDYWGAFLNATSTPQHKSRNE